MKSSLDRVWAVFGKVVGRDYLVEASRTLDELGRHLDDPGDLHGYGPSTVRAIIVREKAFGALLTENQSSITRVLGADWLAQTRASLERVAWLRDLLVRTDSQRKETNEALRAEPRRPRDGRPQGQLAIRGVTRVSSRRGASRPSMLNAGLATGAQAAQRLLGWLSAVVLLPLLATIVSTVRSVVLPVRRLVRATERVARGGTGRRRAARRHQGARHARHLLQPDGRSPDGGAGTSRASTTASSRRRSKSARASWQHLAAHDPLTRLPNRAPVPRAVE